MINRRGFIGAGLAYTAAILTPNRLYKPGRHKYRKAVSGSVSIGGELVTVYRQTPYAGTGYYVAKTGNDANEGTLAAPWLTVQKAATALTAGQTVYIRGGTYNELVTIANSGTLGQYIIFMPYPGETPILDGDGIAIGSGAGLLNFVSKSYIWISGLHIQNVAIGVGAAGSTGKGIFGDLSDHIIVENCHTYNTHSSGIYIQRSNDIVCDGNEVELACAETNSSQECLDLVTCYNFEIKNNYVHNTGLSSTGGEGIDCKDGCHDGTIHHNTVVDVHNVGIYCDAYSAYEYNIQIYQNSVHDCRQQGIAVSSESGATIENIQIYNNLSYNNNYYGIMISNSGTNGLKKDITIINNTCYNNGIVNGAGLYIQSNNIQNIIVRNNISTHAVQWYQIRVLADVPLDELHLDHNLIYGIHNGATEYDGADVIIEDPLYVNAAGGNLHLQVTSPAKDVGSATGMPTADYDDVTRGSPPEIGAFEYV